MSMMRYVGALAVAAGVLGGCGGPEPQAETETEKVSQEIRISTMGNSSLGFGGTIDRTTIRGIRQTRGVWTVMSVGSDSEAPVTAMQLGRDSVTALSAASGRLVATTRAGTTSSFTAAAPLLLTLGAPLAGKLRIYVQTETPSYTKYVTEFSKDGSTWAPYCPHEYQGVLDGEIIDFIAEPMIPVDGAKWDAANGNRIADSGAISLSCAHDAIGGCVTWGYAPWETGTVRGGTTVSLVNHHQTCTRLKRADFCGNGVPHTTLNAGVKKHTPIQVWDSVGVYDMGPQTLSSMEAYWDVNGATCFNADRFRTSDSGNSQYLMLADLRSCPKPRCTTNLGFMMGSAIP